MMKLRFYSMTLAMIVATVVASGSNGQNLRRTAEQSHRRLPHPHPHHHSSSGSGGTSDYSGCLDLNTTEQAQVWPDGPSCDYGSGTGGNGTATGTGDSGGNDDGDGDGDDTVTQYEVVDDDTTSNPYEDFVITQCDTYESLWRWDLHMSCGGDSSNLDSCNCTFAEELFDKGLLVCEDRDRCPRNCPICSTCLSVLGCPETAGPIDRLATSTMIYIIVGAVILLVVALAVFHSRRRRQQQNELKQHLITEDDYDADEGGAGDGGRFEPPNAGTGAGAGAAMVAGGAAVGAWKASKESDSEADTDDCTRSIDATVPTVEDSSTTPFVAMAATGIATVRSEEEDAGPEDENEETKNVDATPEGDNESTNEDDSATMETTSSPSTTGDVGAVREAFLQSLEEDGDVEDQEEEMSCPEAVGEDDMESQSPTNESTNSPDQEEDSQPSTNETGADGNDGDKTSDIEPEEGSDVTTS
mmetsp:Transcript_38410/g.92927  ORF Transcript_38410/g.92927 Transcript_38410/m.92927 type:complete len:471 (+) Transcript_38410:186-1598(+)